MSVESAPQIAVLGGGPIGLETALYARYLGYKVDLFERSSRIAANLRRWGHVRLFSPFFMNATPLGVAAIAAQDSAWQRPEPDAQLLADEYVERYLAPLAATDLLTDSLHADAQVIGVSREGWLKREGVGDPRRKEAGFRLLATSAAGGEREHQADVVIDCTGVFGRHNEAGQGGAPALGERAAEPHIEYELPDLLGADRHRFAGRTTLVIGAGYSAATNVVALAQLAEQAPNTRIVWATRRMPSTPAAGPLRRIPNDRLPQRDALAATANSLVAAADPVEHRPGVVLKQIEFRGENDGFAVTLETPEGEELREVDRVIANVGYRPDERLCSELQIHQCYATGGPMKLAAKLAAEIGESADCLDQPALGPQTLATTEPGYFILGAKSYGRRSDFLLSTGFLQIRDLFQTIGQRDDLDLYATMPPLTPSA